MQALGGCCPARSICEQSNQLDIEDAFQDFPEAENHQEEELLAAEALAAKRHGHFDFDELDEAEPNKELFVDPRFPPTAASLHGLAGSGLGSYEGLQWLRPEQMEPVPDLFAGGDPAGTAPKGAENVLQGKLDDCYLVSAITLLTLDGPLLRQLFSSYLPQEGRCVVRLFLYGSWREVEVDTLIPCDRGEPAFVHSRDGTEIYACLLEKALAKVYGSFHALTGGNMGEALHDLTGSAVEDVNLARLPATSLETEAWRLCKEHRAARNLIACGRTSVGGAAAMNAEAQGLLADHAYSILALAEPKTGGKSKAPRLVRVVNPWGHFVWRGAWSTYSDEWTDALREELKYDGRDDGAFWMEISDFVKFFNRLHICNSGLTRERECARLSFQVDTSLETAGGCTNFTASFGKNAMFRVARPACKQTALKVFVIVSQPDARRDIRSTPGARITYPQMGITLLAQDFDPAVATDAQCCTPNRYEVLQKTSFWNKREVSMVFEAAVLPPRREYRLVPSCYFPDDPGMGRFVLHLYWKGCQDDLIVERVELGARTKASATGALLAGQALPQQPCYRITGPGPVVPITVVLLKAPGLAHKWYLSDPLHTALRALFRAYDVNTDGLLEREEMHALLDALAASKQKGRVSLQEDAKDAIFQEFDRAGRSAVTLGQFIAQSSGLLPALKVPKAELKGHVETLLRGLGHAAELFDSSATSRNLAAGAAMRGTYVAVAPLSCPAEDFECPEASLAKGCGERLPVMSNAAVWSASFEVRQREFFLCPFSKEGSTACEYELHVMSPLEGVSVEPCSRRPISSDALPVAF